MGENLHHSFLSLIRPFIKCLLTERTFEIIIVYANNEQELSTDWKISNYQKKMTSCNETITSKY